MLKIILIGIAVVVALVVVGFLLLVLNQMLGSARQRKQLRARLAPVLDAIDAGQTPDPREVRRLAMNLETRAPLWHALVDAGQPQHFPADLVNRAAYAESDLAVWLAHPNELKSVPDEMQLAKVVPIDTTEAGPVEYYCFRFRVNAPHWAASHNWMTGVSGPYLPGNELPKSQPSGTYSELESFEAKTPEQHVKYLHEDGLKRGTVSDLKKV